jgi:hypothetical protein
MRSCVFFPKLVFFAGFSLYIINIVGRDSEAEMGGAGGAQRLFGVFMNLKTGCAQRARTRG